MLITSRSSRVKHRLFPKKCTELLPKLKHPYVAVNKVRGRFEYRIQLRDFLKTTPRTIKYDDVPCLAMVLLKAWSQ